MTEQERDSADLALEALDQVLVSLGQPPLDQNSHFHRAEPDVGDVYNIVLDKPGAAPIRFILGQEFNVWVGPFSEVVHLNVASSPEGFIRQRIEWVLRSSVTCVVGQRLTKITLQLPGAEPWLRLRVWSTGWAPDLQPSYTPYFQEGRP